VLVLAGLAAGAALAEVAARFASATPAEELLFRAPAGALMGLYSPDATLLNLPTPGYTGTLAAPGYRVDVAIDARGLRVAPDAPATAAGAPVWLAVGDSFTLSLQVDAADTFESRVGAALGIAMHNAGVDGYSTWQSTERARRLDPVVGSEGVLLTYFLGNDLTDDEVYPMLASAGPPPGGRTAGDAGAPPPGTQGAPPPGTQGAPPPGTPGAPPPGAPGAPPSGAPGTPPPGVPKGSAPGGAGSMGFVESLLFRHSRLYGYVRVARARADLDRPDNPETNKFRGELLTFTKPGAARLSQLVSGSQRAVEALRDQTRTHGDHLMVAVAPPSFAVSPKRAADTLGTFGLTEPDVDAPRREILAMLARSGVAACDLAPGLVAAESAGKHPYLRFDGHWTPAGHAVVADAIVACMRREGWR
jgi:hypothetical protein